MDDICEGDAVIPRSEPDHDVMTVYDIPRPYNVALCNWVVGTSMFKASYPVNQLMKLKRHPPRKRSQVS